MFEAKILADSSYEGSRLTTMQLTYPRFIHSEFMTHRMFSRNSASSRAIPVQKMLDAVSSDPVIPIHFGKAQKGMQADEQIELDKQMVAIDLIHDHMQASIALADKLLDLGLHKQVVNRYVEPWMWITVIASATDQGWRHLFSLRCHPAAEPHFQMIANMARDSYEASVPRRLTYGQWHLPLVGFPGDEELSDEELLKVSAARCARVSYLTHDGIRDVHADIDLHDRLRTAIPPHMSAFEHQAMAMSGTKYHGNFAPYWRQYRKLIPLEVTE